MTHLHNPQTEYASEAQESRHDPVYHPTDPFEEWVYTQLEEVQQ